MGKIVDYRVRRGDTHSVKKRLVINRYGNFHLADTDTDTDMLIITDADTDRDKKKTNSPILIPIRRKGIHRN